MNREMSISYRAVKGRVNRLIDDTGDGGTTTNEAKDSFKRWWDKLHPHDRAVARKYLITVLAETRAADSLRNGIADLTDFGPVQYCDSREHSRNPQG